MSILVGESTRLIVQGITGREGLFHAMGCRDYGTEVVGGERWRHEDQRRIAARLPPRPFDRVPDRKALDRRPALAGGHAADAIMEAADAGVELIVCITEGIPVQDMVRVKAFLRGRNSRLLGPNCPGLITPGQAKVGIMPGHIHEAGNVGVISRSGTLTYEAVWQLTNEGLGQTTCVGIGGDPVNGTSFIDVLELFAEDEATEAVVLIGEIGGTAEEEAAAWIGDHLDVPVVGFIAGATAPPGRRMGHAGAIVAGGKGTAAEKKAALAAAGVLVVDSPAEMGARVSEALR